MKHDPNDILDAAVALFDRDGVGVSTSKVAKAAGVSNGTLFNYFPTKQALVDAVYRRLKDDLYDAVGPVDASLPLRDQFEAAWLGWGGWALAHPDRHRVSILLRDADLISPTCATEMDDRLGLGTLLAEAANDGVFVDLPFDYLMATVMAQFELAHRHELTLEQRRAAFDAAWHGITVRGV